MVLAENQLLLPFLSLVTEAELHRTPTVKSEMEASGHALTGLLLTYPIHQACDILFCKGNVVPDGQGPVAAHRGHAHWWHGVLTNDTARSFPGEPEAAASIRGHWRFRAWTAAR